jgi:DNA-binding XRE family transcriptional regulator
MATWYRRTYGRGRRRLVAVCRVTVPANDAATLVVLRHRLGLSQQQMAERVGAASKAVVYQWESRKRTPSPVLWQQVLRVEHGAGQTALTSDTHNATESPVRHDADVRVTSTRKEHGPLPVVVCRAMPSES